MTTIYTITCEKCGSAFPSYWGDSPTLCNECGLEEMNAQFTTRVVRAVGLDRKVTSPLAPEPVSEYQLAIAEAMRPHLPAGWSARPVVHRVDNAIMFAIDNAPRPGRAHGYFRRVIHAALDLVEDAEERGDRPEVLVEQVRRQGIFGLIRDAGDVRDDEALDVVTLC